MPTHPPYYGSRGQARSHHLSACSAFLPDPGRARAPSRITRGFLAPGILYRCQNLGKRQQLMSDMIGQDRRHPRATGSRYSSAEIHPITACHSYSTKGTHIIIVITLMIDKHTLVKATFSTFFDLSGTQTINTTINIQS
jgi:hypothetical protein